MQCRTCGAPLPPNAQGCMRCGTPVTNQQQPYPSYAPQPQQSGPAQGESGPSGNMASQSFPGAPMIQSSMPGFGASPYQQQPQGGSGMYGPPPQQQQRPGSGMYGPAQQQQPGSGMYGPPPQQQSGSGMYGPPPQQQQFGSGMYGSPSQQQRPGSGMYGPPQQQQPQGGSGMYGPPVQQRGSGMYGPPQQQQRSGSGMYGPPSQQGQPATPAFTPGASQRKKPRALVFAIIVLVIAVIAGGAYLFLQPGMSNNAIPSGNTINDHAASIITNVQTADSVDTKTYSPLPGHATTSFKVNQPVYVTFKLNPKAYNVDKQPAYLLVKFYADGKSVIKNEQPYSITQPIDAAYFEAQYYVSTDQGAAEVYWCQKADCSDRQLAQVAHFTVGN